MAIKKLQSNYTTPEQSKRLLDLGLPANSADCYINKICDNRAFQLPDIFSKCTWLSDKKPIPCWSVGQLIKIFRKLCPFGDIIGELIMMNDDIVESFINEFENPNVKWDFSKLEE